MKATSRQPELFSGFALGLQWGSDADVIARFAVEGEPVSKHRVRFSGIKEGRKSYAYTPKATREAEQRIGWAFRSACRGYRFEDDASYGVGAVFHNASWQRRDVDNLLKTVLDGLNKVAWADDSQVSEVWGVQRRGAGRARTEVVIYRTSVADRPSIPCEICGTPMYGYPSRKHQKRTCSRECTKTLRIREQARTCTYCESTFYVHQGNQNRKHCSRECASAARTLTLTCAYCGTTYTKPRSQHHAGRTYCSEVCKASYWREHRTEYAKGVCVDCGGPTSKKSYQRCQSCAILHARSR